MLCSLIKLGTNDKISVDFGAPKASLIVPPPSCHNISIKQGRKGFNGETDRKGLISINVTVSPNVYNI